MKRAFQKRPLELLAPAGTFDIFQSVIDSGCDAVYLGGQILNMRMIRKGYNLSYQELSDAVAIANDRGKKLYITLNSLLYDDEISEAREYLDFLKEIQPHGLIVQDAAIMDLAAKQDLGIPLHSSVMMNVHNLDQINFLWKQGIRRVVLSREMSLAEIRALTAQTKMELEYFTHGDMCVTHGSHCLYSSFLFGMSSNRGRCLKPCRWPFSEVAGEPFPLAVKDLNLHSHLGEMVLAGVSSFKIEGRMRPKEFIVDLVNRYGEALDSFLADPLGYKPPGPDALAEFRKRDFSPGYALGKPGLRNINRRGEGSGMFYSTGKMFSEPTEEMEVPASAEGIGGPKHSLPENKPKLTVAVQSPDQARQALEFRPRRIYLSAEPYAPLHPPTLEELSELYRLCSDGGCELFLGLPRMTNENQGLLLREFFSQKPRLHGVALHHCGALEYIDSERYQLAGDHGMNLGNSRAIQFYTNRGLGSWTSSLELPWDILVNLPGTVRELGLSSPGEILIHGRPTVMYMDHDISDTGARKTDLNTPAGSLPVLKDCWDRYHLLPHKEFTLLPRLGLLAKGGYKLFRVDLSGYDEAQTVELLQVVSEAVKYPERGENLYKKLTNQGGFTHGAHQF